MDKVPLGRKLIPNPALSVLNRQGASERKPLISRAVLTQRGEARSTRKRFGREANSPEIYLSRNRS